MDRQNHQFIHQNDRITDQQGYHMVNNSDFFSFPRIEEQAFYCPPQSFYTFYSAAGNQNLALLQSPFLYPQYPQSFTFPQTSSLYSLVGNQFFKPIDQVSDYQKTYCHTRPSYDDDSKIQGRIYRGSQSCMQNLDKVAKQLALKIEEIQVLSPLEIQRVTQSQTLQKKILPGQIPTTDTMESMSRKQRVERYLLKKQRRKFEKRIVYQCRKSVADNRERVKGRFVKRIRQEVPFKNGEIKYNREE